MYKNKSFICIVPARGGSKRIKNKNLVKFLKKPLIQWTIDFAKKSKYIDYIYISTDDKKIINFSKKKKIKFINRPKTLSNNKIMPDAAVKHAYIKIKKKSDFIVTLQPTSPLRNAYDIDNAIKTIVNSKADSLTSVFQTKAFLWEKKNKGFFKPINFDVKNRPRSQDINFLQENGAIMITREKILLRTGLRLGGKISVSIMSEENSVDIDIYKDLEKAKFYKKLIN